jgi:hypothetical protein
MTERQPEYTVKEYAEIEKVDAKTVRRWILKGAVFYRRTPGGGIRILGVPPQPVENNPRTPVDIRRHPSA